MNDLYIKALSADELRLLTRLFKYKNAENMIKENAENIASGAIEIFGLFKNGKLIGELRVKYRSEDKREAVIGKRAYLYAFRIHKKYQGEGLGKQLLNSVINIVADKGCREFTVGVEDDNKRAIHIYKSNGFDKIIARKYEEYEGCGYAYNLYLKRL